MIRWFLPIVPLLAACQQGESASPSDPDEPISNALLRPSEEPVMAADGQWSLADGALRFAGDDGERIALRCAAGRLAVALPGAKMIGSEERLSFGGGGLASALVVDTSQANVIGEGPVPAELGAMLSAGPGASYGAHAVGPLRPVDPALARDFVATCLPKPAPKPAGACRTQDGATLTNPAIQALGTEPFWSATVDGRCVTYSTPENQSGTRIWTRYSTSGGERRFAGALDGKRFELVVRDAAGCSDGMSDTRYPMAARLDVRGERRSGCARPR